MQDKLNTMLRNAGMSLSDYARLLGVTRVTIHSWSHGRSQPHKLLREKNEELMSAVTRATDAGELPLKGVSRSNRVEVMKTTVFRHQTH
jgi:DNA-binding XRE family transcriptional regulator